MTEITKDTVIGDILDILPGCGPLLFADGYALLGLPRISG